MSSRKPITLAPVVSGNIGRRRWTLVAEPKRVQSLLGKLGYAWEPGIKVLVRFGGKFKVTRAIAYKGSASADLEKVTLYLIYERLG